jgi:ABC-type phosphate transport system substrate-binding protein
MKKRKLCICILLCSSAMSAFAEFAVIVHPSNTSNLTSSEITRIFLGKKSTFNDSKQAVPLTLMKGSEIDKDFTRKVLNKSPTQLKAYWAKRLFTGKGAPPKSVDDKQMIELVSTNPNVIGYIDKSAIDASVKIIAEY